MSERWCADGWNQSAPWWSSEANTQEVEGAWGHWGQQAGESIYRHRLPKGEVIAAHSPFTLRIAPAPVWAVA